MGDYDARTEGEAFDALRAAHAAMGARLAGDAVHLVDLAKSYQAIAGAMAEVARASGRPSVRFEACVKALDLRTKKSALSAFVEG